MADFYDEDEEGYDQEIDIHDISFEKPIPFGLGGGSSSEVGGNFVITPTYPSSTDDTQDIFRTPGATNAGGEYKTYTPDFTFSIKPDQGMPQRHKPVQSRISIPNDLGDIDVGLGKYITRINFDTPEDVQLSTPLLQITEELLNQLSPAGDIEPVAILKTEEGVVNLSWSQSDLVNSFALCPSLYQLQSATISDRPRIMKLVEDEFLAVICSILSSINIHSSAIQTRLNIICQLLIMTVDLIMKMIPPKFQPTPLAVPLIDSTVKSLLYRFGYPSSAVVVRCIVECLDDPWLPQSYIDCQILSNASNILSQWMLDSIIFGNTTTEEFAMFIDIGFNFLNPLLYGERILGGNLMVNLFANTRPFLQSLDSGRLQAWFDRVDTILANHSFLDPLMALWMDNDGFRDEMKAYTPDNDLILSQLGTFNEASGWMKIRQLNKQNIMKNVGIHREKCIMTASRAQGGLGTQTYNSFFERSMNVYELDKLSLMYPLGTFISQFDALGDIRERVPAGDIQNLFLNFNRMRTQEDLENNDEKRLPNFAIAALTMPYRPELGQFGLAAPPPLRLVKNERYQLARVGSILAYNSPPFSPLPLSQSVYRGGEFVPFSPSDRNIIEPKLAFQTFFFSDSSAELVETSTSEISDITPEFLSMQLVDDGHKKNQRGRKQKTNDLIIRVTVGSVWLKNRYSLSIIDINGGTVVVKLNVKAPRANKKVTVPRRKDLVLMAHVGQYLPKTVKLIIPFKNEEPIVIPWKRYPTRGEVDAMFEENDKKIAKMTQTILVPNPTIRVGGLAHSRRTAHSGLATNLARNFR